MNFVDLLSLGNPIPLLLKIGALLGFGFYIIFAFVIVKQVNKMTDTLEVGLEGVLRAVALLHLLFSVGALFVTLAIL